MNLLSFAGLIINNPNKAAQESTTLPNWLGVVAGCLGILSLPISGGVIALIGGKSASWSIQDVLFIVAFVIDALLVWGVSRLFGGKKCTVPFFSAMGFTWLYVTLVFAIITIGFFLIKNSIPLPGDDVQLTSIILPGIVGLGEMFLIPIITFFGAKMNISVIENFLGLRHGKAIGVYFMTIIPRILLMLFLPSVILY